MTADAVLSTEVRYVDAEGSAVTTTLAALDTARVSRALPVRKVGSYAGQRHYSGLFWSATTKGHVPYESRLELDRLWLADFDSAVTWIASQPMWLSGQDSGQLRRHVPDLLLLCDAGPPLLVDVKPEQFAEQPQVAAVFEWTTRVCRLKGWRYEVWTGGSPVRLANIRAVSVARRTESIDPTVAASVRAVARTGMTLGQVGDLCGHGTPGQQRLAALAQLWSGAWSSDFDRPLSSESIITVGAAA